MERNTDNMEQTVVLGRKFFVQLEGKTNGAHQDIVTRLKDIGYTEVESVEESEILLVFCPIVSRVGTDISYALENIPDGKQTVLVVMHPTFNPDHVVAKSRRLVEKANVKLTVDCLIYDGKLLDSKRNDTAWTEIEKFIDHLACEEEQPHANSNSDCAAPQQDQGPDDSSAPQGSDVQSSQNGSSPMLCDPVKMTRLNDCSTVGCCVLS